MVALRKESVDRNPTIMHDVSNNSVALRKESVDRNTVMMVQKAMSIKSLSARRAWIEINFATC